MNKFIFGFLMLGTVAMAAITEVDRAEFPVRSLDPNSGFESGKQGVSASGGTLSVVTSGSNLLRGKTSLTWDSTAASQTLRGNTLTVPQGLIGKNGLAQIAVKATSDTATHLFEVLDGSGNTLNSMSITSSTAYALDHSLNFIFPSTSVRWGLKSVASNEPTVAIDDAFIGSAYNINDVSQAQFVGSAYFPQTTNCAWARTNTAVGAFSTDADCPAPTIDKQNIGVWQTTDADLPRVTINSLPPGIYKVTVIGQLYGAGDWTMAISDGTNTRGYASGSGNGAASFNPANTSVAWFEYTTAGNRSFEVYGSSSSGAINLDNQQANDRTTFLVERYPLQSQQIAAADQTDFGWTSGGTLTITGTTSNPTKGTTAFDQVWYRRVGDSMQVRIEYRQTALGSAAAGSGDYLFTIPGGWSIDTTKVNAYSTVEGSGSWVNNSCVGSVTASLSASNFTGCVSVYDSTKVRFCGLDATTYGCVNSASFYSLDNASTGYYATFTVPISGWTQGQRAPALVNSVLSPYEGAAKIAYATITNTGTPTVTRQSGTWISSITDNGTGDMTINFVSGTFSTIPTCVVSPSPDDASGSIIQIYDFGTARSTSLIRVKTYNGSLAADDQSVDIICMGAR